MWGWAEIKSSTGTLTMNVYIECSWRLAIYRESTCYTTKIECDCHLRLAILWGNMLSSLCSNTKQLVITVMILSSLCEARQNALFHAAWIVVLEDSVWLALPCMFASKGNKKITIPYYHVHMFMCSGVTVGACLLCASFVCSISRLS